MDSSLTDALIATGDERLIEFGRVPISSYAAEHDLIEVKAISVNRGELHRLIDSTPGWRPGWDFAGTVASSPSHSFPRGAPVFGMVSGGSWARTIVAPSGACAAIPEGMSFTTAAALPVAGLTALRLVRQCGDLRGRTILITGAAGGVGRLAVQLAHAAGAEVTALVGSSERVRGLDLLGADHTVVGMPSSALRGLSFDLVLDSVGGDCLRTCLEACAVNGVVLSYGNSSRSPTNFSVSDFYPQQATLRGFYLLRAMEDHPVAEDLATLAQLVLDGRLKLEVAVVRDWDDAADVLRELQARAIPGKAVLRLPKLPFSRSEHER
jgi:NADPH:quinone reductase